MDSLDSLVSGTSVSAVSGVETRIESAALQPLSSLDFFKDKCDTPLRDIQNKESEHKHLYNYILKCRTTRKPASLWR